MAILLDWICFTLQHTTTIKNNDLEFYTFKLFYFLEFLWQ